MPATFEAIRSRRCPSVLWTSHYGAAVEPHLPLDDIEGLWMSLYFFSTRELFSQYSHDPCRILYKSILTHVIYFVQNWMLIFIRSNFLPLHLPILSMVTAPPTCSWTRTTRGPPWSSPSTATDSSSTPRPGDFWSHFFLKIPLFYFERFFQHHFKNKWVLRQTQKSTTESKAGQRLMARKSPWTSIRDKNAHKKGNPTVWIFCQ